MAVSPKPDIHTAGNTNFVQIVQTDDSVLSYMAVLVQAVGWAKAHLRRAHHRPATQYEMVGTLSLCPPYAAIIHSAACRVSGASITSSTFGGDIGRL